MTPQNSAEQVSLLSVSSSPHVRSEDNVRGIMLDVIIALMPALVWSIYIFGFRALSVTVISIVACIISEAAFQKIVRRPVAVGDLSAVVTGLLLAFSLPVTVPLWLPAVGGVFSIVIAKQMFGGIGKNVVNPAAAGRVFLFLSYAGHLSRYISVGQDLIKAPALDISIDYSKYADAFSSATPLYALKQGQLPDVKAFDMLLGNMQGCIGEVSALLLIAGGLYLMFRRVITWHIPVSFMGTVALLTFLFPKSAFNTEYVVAQLLTGGLVIGAIFMATDYTTCPMTTTGRLIYGAGCGALTVFIRYFGSYPEGVSFAIMIMNLLAWYIDKLTKPVRFGGVARVSGKGK